MKRIKKQRDYGPSSSICSGCGVHYTAFDAHLHADHIAPTQPMKTPRIYTRCPACKNDTLIIGDDKHLICSWFECPDPTLIDRDPRPTAFSPYAGRGHDIELIESGPEYGAAICRRCNGGEGDLLTPCAVRLAEQLDAVRTQAVDEISESFKEVNEAILALKWVWNEGRGREAFAPSPRDREDVQDDAKDKAWDIIEKFMCNYSEGNRRPKP